MKTIILFLVAVALGVFAVCAVVQNIKIKNELKAEKKKEKQNAKIDEQTVENINIVAGGDVHAGNDILHQLAEKRK